MYKASNFFSSFISIFSALFVILSLSLLLIPSYNSVLASTTTLSWTARTSMPTARGWMPAVGASNGKIYVIGGQKGSPNYEVVGTMEEYDPTTDTWSTKASMPTARTAFGSAEVNGKIYAIGGQSGGPVATVEEYDIVSDTWTSRTGMPTPREAVAAVTGSNGKIYAVGGYYGHVLNTVEEYDPATDTWSTKTSMPTSRYHVGLATGSNGKIYAAGGVDNADGLASFEEYDPATDTWSTKTNMPTARYGLGLVAASNKLYAVGGYHPNFGGVLATVEEYDPATNTWLNKISMPTRRMVLGVATATNGKIYAVGGDIRADGTFTGKVEEAIVTILIPNNPPTINPISNSTINEGDIYFANGSFDDSDSTYWTGTVNYGDGGGTQPLSLSGNNFTLSHIYKDNGSYTLTVNVTDNQGATGTGTTTVTVNNINPSVGVITAPTDPIQVNSSITVSAIFTDAGTLDTHTASWDWGDGITAGTVTESNGSGSVSDSHTYTTAGVYTVKLTVTDDDNGTGESSYQYVVAYDPYAGYVTGGGTITSPPGAYMLNPSLTGKAIFGLVSRYQNGANVPTGQTQFRFVMAQFTFNSTSYNWLVVGGPKAQYKGLGTINGDGDYGFILTSIDGQINGGGGTDKFRIKIYDKITNAVIYDNQTAAPDTSDPTTEIDSGSIIIHH